MKRKTEVVYQVTREDLYEAACVKSEPCEAHRETVDKMIERLEAKQ